MTQEFDFIVVGAGSAGCLVVSQLAEADSSRVLLIEAGDDARERLSVKRPAEYLSLQKTDLDWDFECSAGKALADRKLSWPRGRTLGGSSAINAMIYHEGFDEDYLRWQQACGDFWSLENVRAAFKRLRAQFDSFHVEEPAEISIAASKFLSSARRYRSNANQTETPHVYRRTARRGIRQTAADAFLTSAKTKNLELRSNTLVDRVAIRNGQASGVILADGNATEIKATQSVILCAGAIASPAILQRSGIGPAESLSEIGITPVVDAAEVGSNLKDHLIFPVIFATKGDPFPATWSQQDVSLWETQGRGPIASNLAEAGGFFDSSRDDRARVIQFHVTPTHYLRHPAADAPAAMTLGVSCVLPKSKGCLRIASPDPNVAPRIDAAYLQDSTDLDVMVDAVQLAREIAAIEPLRDFIDSEILPGSRRDTPQKIAKAITRYALTLYHPVGTCRMGSDKASVLDECLRVRGVEKLNVIDASAFPEIPRANPNAATMMLALRGVESLLSKNRPR